MAYLKGYINVVEYLLHQGADSRDGFFGQSFLHRAASDGHLRVVEYLVNQNADINAKDKDGRTPMELASEKGKSAVVEFLKSKGGQ